MPKDGTATRDKILDSAQELIFKHGFTATTLDLVLKDAKLTKGAFFHHFSSKDDLALALIERYLANEKGMLAKLIEGAETVTRDPYQQILIIIGFIIQAIEDETPLSHGCLFASYAFEMSGFDARTKELAREGFTVWRKVIGAKMAEMMEKHPPRIPTDPYDLADTMLAAFEGGVVIARMENDPQVIARKMAEFRKYVELLFDVEKMAKAS